MVVGLPLFEKRHQHLGSDDLLRLVEHEGHEQSSQVVEIVAVLGGAERDPQGCGFSCATEHYSDGVCSVVVERVEHLVAGGVEPAGGVVRRVSEEDFDEIRSGKDIADNGQKQVDGDVEEDNEDDGGRWDVGKGVLVERSGEGGPHDEQEAEAADLVELCLDQEPVHLLGEDVLHHLPDKQRHKHAKPDLLHHVCIQLLDRVASLNRIAEPELRRRGVHLQQGWGNEGTKNVADKHLA